MNVGGLVPQNPTIKIGKTETFAELLGLKPDKVTDLAVYSNNKKADLNFLRDYPNVEKLFVNGDFANADGLSELKQLNSLTLLLPAEVDLSNVKLPALKSLSLYKQLNPGALKLMDKLEYLELMDMRKVADLSFVEDMKGLKKLYLMSLPAVEKLPDFGKMPSLYGIKIYELHKLNDIESLTKSAIRFLAFSLAADKLSGTKIADVLLRMEFLERFSGSLDRSCKRDNVLTNRLEKAGKSDLLNRFDMGEWLRL
ncbi:MAG: hypothetical protein K2J77_08710 [Oscillospiraceae bacterium]|nr:hypothetical protein [Oscillospiraceae bacterium]